MVRLGVAPSTHVSVAKILLSIRFLGIRLSFSNCLYIKKEEEEVILRPLHRRITEKLFLLISLSQASRHHTAACPRG